METHVSVSPRKLVSRLKIYLLDRVLAHPILDLLAVLVVVALHFGAVVLGWLPDWIATIPSDHRLLIYGALATVSTLAAGITNAAVGFYHSGSGQHSDELRRRYGTTIRMNFMSISRWLWFATLLSLAALAIDGDALPKDPSGPTHFSQWIFEFALLVTVLKFARLTYLQDLVLKANELKANPGGS